MSTDVLKSKKFKTDVGLNEYNGVPGKQGMYNITKTGAEIVSIAKSFIEHIKQFGEGYLVNINGSGFDNNFSSADGEGNSSNYYDEALKSNETFVMDFYVGTKKDSSNIIGMITGTAESGQ
ncbi:hypothetical protein H4219_003729 [Mycoemilia scoparia]|uniref:Uncharacterized protein n=1 Tax=Mycoemilia scoparia TaxID=417184 RepID=A0A9W7ZU96_9FUNG|nr:hypothetical protein H4219_003729 [Mycoemilia scoparia]